MNAEREVHFEVRSAPNAGHLSARPKVYSCQQRSLPPFAERDLWNIRLLKQPHSDLMPPNWITLAHFSVSLAISLPKSAAEPASAVPPSSARRAFILGSSRAALTSHARNDASRNDRSESA